MKLAIRGGCPVRKKLFPAYCTVGKEEKKAVGRVIDSGVLSRYLGCWHKNFLGGPEVQALESEWAKYFGVKHAMAVNSATSGLYAAMGAAGVGPGDEVIVSPYTMSASATAALVYGAIPVFADIESDCYCIDPCCVEALITPRTRAIVAVDIFGLPYNVPAINALARKYNLTVIEDAAQAPGALMSRKFTGALGDIGVYSLNYHKHIHCGEGGVVVTDNDELADRVRLIRNHAESVVGDKGTRNIVNMVGFNFRMTEVEAAISRCQLKKLKPLLMKRQGNCEYIASRLKDIPAITLPTVRDHCTHAYYVHPFKFMEEVAGVSRDRFIDAVRAELPASVLREGEGPLLSCGYVKPLYMQPLYQKRIAYGSKGFPFSRPSYKGTVNYEKGICPVTELMHEKEFFAHELMHSAMRRADMDDLVNAFFKVWENREELKTRR